MSNNIPTVEADVVTSLTAVETLSHVGTKALATKRAIYAITKRSFDIVLSIIRMFVFAAYYCSYKSMLYDNR